jgi:hypothetical protein
MVLKRTIGSKFLKFNGSSGYDLKDISAKVITCLRQFSQQPPHHHRTLRRCERICSERLTNRTSIPADMDGEMFLRSPPSEWRKKMVSSDNALLIIDMQQGLFRGPISPRSADAVLTNIRLLIANARDAQVSVFFARHIGPDDSPFSEKGR